MSENHSLADGNDPAPQSTDVEGVPEDLPTGTPEDHIPAVGLDKTAPVETDEDEEPAADELSWEVVRDNPHDPFTARLVFNLGDTEVLWWNLDPYGLKELTEALHLTRLAQAAIINGEEEPPRITSVARTTPRKTTTTADSDDKSTKSSPRPAARKKNVPDDRPWVVRHKVFTALMCLCFVLFLFSFFSLSATAQ